MKYNYADKLRAAANWVETDATPSQVGLSAGELREMADAFDALRRTADELLTYINGIAKNSTKVVESMRDALNRQ